VRIDPGQQVEIDPVEIKAAARGLHTQGCGTLAQHDRDGRRLPALPAAGDGEFNGRQQLVGDGIDHLDLSGAALRSDAEIEVIAAAFSHLHLIDQIISAVDITDILAPANIGRALGLDPLHADIILGLDTAGHGILAADLVAIVIDRLALKRGEQAVVGAAHAHTGILELNDVVFQHRAGQGEAKDGGVVRMP